MKDEIKVLITEEELTKRIAELGAEISEEYKEEEVTLICILKGSLFFTAELAKRITGPVKFEFMRCSSYGNGTVTNNDVKVLLDTDESIEGKNIIVVEDIIDTGNTLSYLMEHLSKRNPKSLKLAAMLDKPDRRVRDVKVDYIGFKIPDLFVVGYGLDYAQSYRQLPYIGVVQTD